MKKQKAAGSAYGGILGVEEIKTGELEIY